MLVNALVSQFQGVLGHFIFQVEIHRGGVIFDPPAWGALSPVPLLPKETSIIHARGGADMLRCMFFKYPVCENQVFITRQCCAFFSSRRVFCELLYKWLEASVVVDVCRRRL